MGYIASVDLGGTKIAAALFSKQGELVCQSIIPTLPELGAADIVNRICAELKRLQGNEKIDAISICSPGPLDPEQGVIIQVDTLMFKNVPICQMISNEMNVPVYLENDANAAALGEATRGAGSGAKNMIYITVSTGIGCGIIIDGKIFSGAFGNAGEFGHICVDPDGIECTCGNIGCLQAYCSGTSIAGIAWQRMIDGKAEGLKKYQDLDAKILAAAAREGEPDAVKIWNDMGRRLGQGISILIQLFNPEIIVLGGGVCNDYDLFSGPMTDFINKHIYNLGTYEPVIKRAELAPLSGIYGVFEICKMKGI